MPDFATQILKKADFHKPQWAAQKDTGHYYRQFLLKTGMIATVNQNSNNSPLRTAEEQDEQRAR